MAKIQTISATEFKVKNGVHDMTLTQVSDGWEVMTRNPSNRAWRGNYPSFRVFGTLKDVAEAYKSWAGIEEIAAGLHAERAIHNARSCAAAA